MSSRTSCRPSSAISETPTPAATKPCIGGVVVGLEGDPRLEAGDRARAVDQPVALAVGGAARSTARRPGRRAAGCACARAGGRRGSARYIGSLEQVLARRCRRPRRGRASRSRARGRARRACSSGAASSGSASDQRQLDAGVRGAEGGDRERHQRRGGGLERGQPQAPAAQAGDRLQLGLGLGEPGEDRVGVAHERLARLGEPDAARVALHERACRPRARARRSAARRRTA